MKKVVRSKVNKYDVPAEFVTNDQGEAAVSFIISFYFYHDVTLTPDTVLT
jgi:hypothetical protein